MQSRLITIILVTLVQCSNKDTVTFDSTTRQIFFQADVSNNNGLLEFYKNSKYLSLDPPPQGYTTYPPLSALGQGGRSEQYIFRFCTHPFFSFPFREGELTISKRKANSKELYSSPMLKFIFETQEQSEHAYKELVDIYTKLSTRKRFSNYKDMKNAEFTDDKSNSIKEIGFLQGKGDIIANGYVIVFGLGNDIDN